MFKTKPMSESITNVDELEMVIGKTPTPMKLKVINFIDEGAIRWIAASPLMFAAVGQPGKLNITIGGGTPGWACATPHELRFALSSLDDPLLLLLGHSFGAFFMLPNIREIMRVNGRISRLEGEDVVIAIDECFSHCGKALLRSEFWAAQPGVQVPQAAPAFGLESRFMALATIASSGRADISPKGDMAGTMTQFYEDCLLFPDRPGNRRVDGFRNILTQPQVAALLVVPGSAQVVRVVGMANMTTNIELRERFAIQDKAPRLVTGINDMYSDMRHSDALLRANLWPAPNAPQDINPAEIGVAQMKHSTNLAVRLAATALSKVPKLLEKGLESDYKKNLF